MQIYSKTIVKLYFRVTIPFYIPTVMINWLVFLHPHQHYCHFFWSGGHFESCVVISHCILICIFLMTYGGEHLFMCLLTICILSLKCLCMPFAHILIGFFSIECREFFICFLDTSLRYVVCTNFF